MKLRSIRISSNGFGLILSSASFGSFTRGCGITLKAEVQESLEYVLGLLNSRLLSVFIKSISTPMRGGFFRYFTQYMEQIPIRSIDFSDDTDKARHDKMVSLVNGILAAKAETESTKTETDRRYAARKVLNLDRQIDDLVYELYGLSPEEIELIEASNAPQQESTLPAAPILF